MLCSFLRTLLGTFLYLSTNVLFQWHFFYKFIFKESHFLQKYYLYIHHPSPRKRIKRWISNPSLKFLPYVSPSYVSCKTWSIPNWREKSMDNIYKNNILSDEKRKQLWLSDLCVKYGELSVTPSASSLSSSCYSGSTDHSGLFSQDFFTGWLKHKIEKTSCFAKILSWMRKCYLLWPLIDKKHLNLHPFPSPKHIHYS